MRRFLSLAVILALTSFAFGKVRVDPRNIVANQKPGYCGWAVLETIGYEMEIPVLKGILEKRKNDPIELLGWKEPNPYTKYQKDGLWWEELPPNVLSEWTCGNKLKKLGVKYRLQHTGNFDLGILKHAVTHYGCLIALSDGGADTCSGCNHAVILTDLNDSTISFIDSNDKREYTKPRAHLTRYWTGFAVELLKD